MKLGISVKIDVTKIDKSRIFKGEKGKYLDLTTFINTEEEDKYGNHGFISQSVSKEERDQGIQTEILGNCKIFYGLNPSPGKKDSDQGQNRQDMGNSSQKVQDNGHTDQMPDDDTIPF